MIMYVRLIRIICGRSVSCRTVGCHCQSSASHGGVKVTRPVSSYEATPTSAIGIADPLARIAARRALTELGIAVTIEANDADSLVAAASAAPPMVGLVGAGLRGGGVHAVHRLRRDVPGCLVVLLAADPTEVEM